MKKTLLALGMMILMLFAQGCSNTRQEYDDPVDYDGNSIIDDNYIEEKLTAHTWERFSNHLSSYIRYTFNDDGTYEYESEYYKDSTKSEHSHGTWSVRDNILYRKSKSYLANGETNEYTFVELDENDVANDILSLGDDEFYVSDNYFVYNGAKYSIYEE